MIKILWVDDQLDIINTFSHTLDPLAAEIEYEIDGERALEAIKKKPYDIALIDLAMPPGKWGGLWLLKEIKNLNLNLATIVVSGEGAKYEIIEAHRLGMDDYVTKEKLDEDLINCVKRVLDKTQEKGKIQVIEIIKKGESNEIEFKATLSWDIDTHARNPEVEFLVMKAIVSFLNTSGGDLLIGVANDRSIVGIEKDRFPNEDQFQLHFWNKFRDMIGIEYKDYIVETNIVLIDQLKIFQVKCRPSKTPVYIRWKQQDLFYIRTGPRAEKLNLKKAVKYIEEHFKD